ncbi:MAG: tail protein X [Alistipes sp.]|nr:tail protein X [Alistipes sp.]
MESFNYTTREGDRVDQLAHRFYGSAAGIRIIIDANPQVPVEAVYPLGTRLIIPIIEEAEAPQKQKNLPPWKQ